MGFLPPSGEFFAGDQTSVGANPRILRRFRIDNMLLQHGVYAIGGDHDVGFDRFAVSEFQSCRSGALFKSNTAMARADGAWREACCERIQQVGPMHAVYAIP